MLPGVYEGFHTMSQKYRRVIYSVVIKVECDKAILTERQIEVQPPKTCVCTIESKRRKSKREQDPSQILCRGTARRPGIHYNRVGGSPGDRIKRKTNTAHNQHNID